MIANLKHVNGLCLQPVQLLTAALGRHTYSLTPNGVGTPAGWTDPSTQTAYLSRAQEKADTKEKRVERRSTEQTEEERQAATLTCHNTIERQITME